MLFGLTGVVWCVAFAAWFRNRPEENPNVNAGELALIRSGTQGATEQAHARVPWGELLRSGNLWAICIMYFLMSYPWYFHVNYLPSYLEEMHAVARDSNLGAVYKGGPLILGAVGCFGVSSAWLITTRPPQRSMAASMLLVWHANRKVCRPPEHVPNTPTLPLRYG